MIVNQATSARRMSRLWRKLKKGAGEERAGGRGRRGLALASMMSILLRKEQRMPKRCVDKVGKDLCRGSEGKGIKREKCHRDRKKEKKQEEIVRE